MKVLFIIGVFLVVGELGKFFGRKSVKDFKSDRRNYELY